MLVVPLFSSKGGDTLACKGGGGWGPNSDEATDSLVLYAYCNPSIKSILNYLIYRILVFYEVGDLGIATKIYFFFNLGQIIAIL